MKKIVSAVALAAVAAGLATAEIKTSINARLGTTLFQKTTAGEKSGATDTTTVGDLDGVTSADAFTFKATGDVAGITLNYNPNIKSSANVGKDFWVNGNGVEFTGYLNPADWLQLKFGAHKDGITYAEQAKKDTDDTNWSAAGKYAFLNKLGIVTKNSTGYFIDSLTDIANGGQLFGLMDFKFSDVGGGNLLVRVTGVDTYNTATDTIYTTTTANTKEDGTGDDKTYTTKVSVTKGQYNWIQKKDAKDDDPVMYVAPGAMIAWKNDVINVNVDFQMPTSKDIAAGVFVSPLGLADGALQLTVGGTFSKNLSSKDDKLGIYGSNSGKKQGSTAKKTENTYAADEAFYGIDLRVRYVAGDFHIANAFNFTGATEEGLVKPASSLSGKAGDFNIWDGVFATYKLNDKITITGDVQVNATVGDNSTKNGDGEYADMTWLDLYVTPGIMYTVGKGATITTGLHIGVADLTGNDNSTAQALTTKTTIAVPIITRIKL